MNFIYKPSRLSLMIDLFILIIGYYIVLDWFPLTTDTPFEKYSALLLIFTFIWFLISYFFKRYKPLRQQSYFRETIKLFMVSIIAFLMFFIGFQLWNNKYSEYVLSSIIIGIFTINFIFYFLYFAWRYAVQYEVSLSPNVERQNAHVKPAPPIDDDTYIELCSTICLHSGQQVLNYLLTNMDLRSGNVSVSFSNNIFEIKQKPHYQYSTIINLERLNNMRGINKMFHAINDKLPDDGIFICCFESKSTQKKRILKKYFWGLNYLMYFFDYIFKRIVPKIFITRRLYYDLTDGKNRILSKAEVLGRLYYCGYEVIKEKKIGDLNYIVSRRKKQSEPVTNKTYGPLIRLKRSGKNGKIFNVFKIRTMHSYSEYLQGYIYKRDNLQTGGKFKKDIRVNTIGRFLRKYWLDELPMLINLVKGDLKIVGVRPLSAHYLSLYDKELQELRRKHKPGLFPPFYADMPKTLDEIQASEMKYLRACEQKGVFRTDVYYLVLILKNIFVKKAHSA